MISTSAPAPFSAATRPEKAMRAALREPAGSALQAPGCIHGLMV